jgi:hypothetical protein
MWRQIGRGLIFGRGERWSQKLLWILDEHCSGRGDWSIAGGWNRAREEIFRRFCVEVGRVVLKMSDELRNV